MNTIVITGDEADYGVGSTDRVTFVDCSWHIDEHGTLHIKREQGKGNCAAFASGRWLTVLDGGVLKMPVGGER